MTRDTRGGLVAPKTATLAGLVAFVVTLVTCSALLVAFALAADEFPDEAGVIKTVTTTQSWDSEQDQSGPPTTVTTETTTESSRGERSILDRLISPPVMIFLEAGVALLASFIVGGVTQHLLLGRFGFALGPLNFPEVTEEQVETAGSTALRGLQDASQVGGAEPPPPPTPPIPSGDANLQLVSLRIGIEQRLNELAAQKGLEAGPAGRSSPHRIVHRLVADGVLPQPVASPLLDLIDLGNKAAHGVEVESGAGGWARRDGPRLLQALDALIKPH